jgi:hypothetical protein
MRLRRKIETNPDKPELLKTVRLVRGNLTKAQRVSIGALVTLDVHNKDSVMELAALNVDRVTDFDWQANLRYYWEPSRTSALTEAVHSRGQHPAVGAWAVLAGAGVQLQQIERVAGVVLMPR